MKQVLVIEDQAEIRELIRMTLELEAFDIHEAADGTAGLNAARRLRPSVILLDVMMPGSLDGFDVCRQVKADTNLRRTRVVMLTARASAEDKARAHQAGADDFLSKPFSPRQLLATVAG